jgi:hypothetical protein
LASFSTIAFFEYAASYFKELVEKPAELADQHTKKERRSLRVDSDNSSAFALRHHSCFVEGL